MTTNINILKSSLTYWDAITESQRQDIIGGSTTLRFKAGEMVHSALDDCVGMFIVKTGELRAYILSDGGRDFTLFRTGPGQVCTLSASCLLESITFDIFIEAEKDSELILINAVTLSKLHNESPLIENFALKKTTERFSAVVEVLEKMLFMPFEKRLAEFLCAESKNLNSLEIPLTHEQIAKYLGSAREVVSRHLKRMEKDGLVALYRGGVKLRDYNALEALLLE